MTKPTVTTSSQFYGIFRHDSMTLTKDSAVGKKLYDSLPSAQNALGKLRLQLPKYMSGVMTVKSVQVVVLPQAIYKLTPVTIIGKPSATVPILTPVPTPTPTPTPTVTPTVNSLTLLLLTDLENLTLDQLNTMVW